MPDRRTNVGGWSLAVALGLLALAFLRLVPPENRDRTTRGTNGDISAVGPSDEDEERGRLAIAPSDIPAKGWKDILLRAYAGIGEHRVMALAAGMTYYSILAIFPALAALVAI